MGLAAIIEAVTPLLSFGGEVLVGEENLSREGAPPRTVWVPGADSFGPPSERFGAQQRALHTLRCAATVHLWGSDLAAAEAMRDDFINALRRAVGPNYELQGGIWLGQTNLGRGRVYLLSLLIHAPIVEPAPQRVTLTGETSDVAFEH